jgi:hypothetical protein
MATLVSKRAMFSDFRRSKPTDPKYSPTDYIKMKEEHGEVELSSQTYDFSQIPPLTPLQVEAEVTFGTYRNGKAYVSVVQMAVKPAGDVKK